MKYIWYSPQKSKYPLCISFNIYQNLIFSVSTHWQFSSLNTHTSEALNLFEKFYEVLLYAGICIFVRGGCGENAYSSLKSVERPINLCIILFDNHSPFQNFCFHFCKYIPRDIFDKNDQTFEKEIFSAKNVFLP